MRRKGGLLLGLAVFGSAAIVLSAGSTVVAAAGPGRPVRSCDGLASIRLAHTTVVSATSVPATGSVPAHCAVQLVITNPPANDQIRVGVWLPEQDWNGRFQGIGGGGFSGGSPTTVPVTALQAGYAAAATDAGHTGFSGSFALNPDGTLNWQLIADFGYLGIHEMTVAAKALVSSFYGRRSFHSYFNGCSTGGRQGLMEAQRYPADYDGIAAGAPAINWTKFHPAQLWGQLQMGHGHPPCLDPAWRGLHAASRGQAAWLFGPDVRQTDGSVPSGTCLRARASGFVPPPGGREPGPAEAARVG